MLPALPPVIVLSQWVSVLPAAAVRRYSGRNAMAKPPASAPGIEPMPPSTTAERMKIERNNVKLSGAMKPTLVA